MKSFDFEAVVHGCDVYCKGCLPEGISIDSEDVHPIFADSEVETTLVCCVCEEVHNYMSIMDQMPSDQQIIDDIIHNPQETDNDLDS